MVKAAEPRRFADLARPGVPATTAALVGAALDEAIAAAEARTTGDDRPTRLLGRAGDLLTARWPSRRSTIVISATAPDAGVAEDAELPEVAVAGQPA
jgi:hypothetical protein